MAARLSYLPLNGRSGERQVWVDSRRSNLCDPVVYFDE